MTSRERILAAWSGGAVDHVPLTTWCFGLPAPPAMAWRTRGRRVDHWYSLRMEHLHTTAQPWTLDDDVRRVAAWRSLAVDDLLDVSVPWSLGPDVQVNDLVAPDGQVVLAREYATPAGRLRHAVRRTAPDPPGWPVQADHVPLFEDLNLPRAVAHLVRDPDDVPAVRHLYAPPDERASGRLAERLEAVGRCAVEQGVAVQAWSAFGLDAAVWLAGAEGAVMLALDEPRAFGELIDIIAATDRARTALALASPAVDLVVQRGWYSATDFWSPALFDTYVLPHLASLAELVHRHGRRLAYVMTTGVETLGPRLAGAGVDVLYFVDPLQDGVSLDWARAHLADRMTIVGGLSSLTLNGGAAPIRAAVHRAVETLGPTGRFILHPVDALFPDTPWAGVEALIAAWQEAW